MATESLSLSSIEAGEKVDVTKVQHSYGAADGAHHHGGWGWGWGWGIVLFIILVIIFFIIIEVGKFKWFLRRHNRKHGSSSSSDDVVIDECGVDHGRALLAAIVAAIVFLIILAIGWAILRSFKHC